MGSSLIPLPTGTLLFSPYLLLNIFVFLNMVFLTCFCAFLPLVGASREHSRHVLWRSIHITRQNIPSSLEFRSVKDQKEQCMLILSWSKFTHFKYLLPNSSWFLFFYRAIWTTFSLSWLGAVFFFLSPSLLNYAVLNLLETKGYSRKVQMPHHLRTIVLISSLLITVRYLVI